MPYTDFGRYTYDADNANRLTVTVAEADAYFDPKQNLRGKKWRDINDTRRLAGLREAQRTLELNQGRIMATPTDSDELGPRDDYAVYEMALYLLTEIYPEKGKSPNPVRVSKKGKKVAESADLRGIQIPAHVQRWLGRNMIKVTRG